MSELGGNLEQVEKVKESGTVEIPKDSMDIYQAMFQEDYGVDEKTENITENLGEEQKDTEETNLEYDENGTRELTVEEKQELKEATGWPDKKIDSCRIGEDGVIHLKTICEQFEGQQAQCGVCYERKTIEYNGIKIEGVFPVFDSTFDTQLEESDYQSSSVKQFNEANKKLKEAIEKNPELKKQFTQEQLQDIENGDTPRGYTWHHNEEPGKMQLVKTEDHDKTIGGAAHTGGNSIWGNKSVDKAGGDTGDNANSKKGETF